MYGLQHMYAIIFTSVGIYYKNLKVVKFLFRGFNFIISLSLQNIYTKYFSSINYKMTGTSHEFCKKKASSKMKSRGPTNFPLIIYSNILTTKIHNIAF